MSIISAKWKRNAASGSQSYAEGVNAPRRSWQQATEAADQARIDGLALADQRDAFREGVRSAGDTKWKRNAVKLGSARFAQGVKEAEPEFNSGFSKYHAVISGLTLPPRGSKGSPENLDRVAMVANALHNAKVGG